MEEDPTTSQVLASAPMANVLQLRSKNLTSERFSSIINKMKGLVSLAQY